MRLETPIGLFTAHFHLPRRVPYHPSYVVATLHRGGCIMRLDPVADGRLCAADSPAVVKITLPKRRPVRKATARTAALAKAMRRLGLNREERAHLWRAYFAQVAVLPRRCVAVVTTCQNGHRVAVAGIGPFGTLFPSAREFCSFKLIDGRRCEWSTIEAKHRYLYVVDLPLGRRARRRRALEEIAAPIVVPLPPLDEDVPF